jgi:hypothetical protein
MHAFRSKLLSKLPGTLSASSLDRFSQELMDAFLLSGSQTDGNMNCYNHIEYGLVRKRRRGLRKACGLKVKGKPLALSQIMNVVENLRIPRQVKESFPDLTTPEWDAVTRMLTMILLALEREVEPKARRR